MGFLAPRFAVRCGGWPRMEVLNGRTVSNPFKHKFELNSPLRGGGDTAMSLTVGQNGNVTLISFYPRESLVSVALTGLVGDRSLAPVGSAYLSRCTYSWASP